MPQSPSRIVTCDGYTIQRKYLLLSQSNNTSQCSEECQLPMRTKVRSHWRSNFCRTLQHTEHKPKRWRDVFLVKLVNVIMQDLLSLFCKHFLTEQQCHYVEYYECSKLHKILWAMHYVMYLYLDLYSVQVMSLFLRENNMDVQIAHNC